MSCDCSDMGKCGTHQAIRDLENKIEELEERLKKLEEEPKVVYKTVYVNDDRNP